jgi:hypothetical protein
MLSTVPYPEISSTPSPECDVPLKDWGCELYYAEPSPPLAPASAAPPSLRSLFDFNSSKSHPSEPPPSDSANLYPRHSPAPASGPRPISTRLSSSHSSPQAISELKLTESSCDVSPSEKPNERASSSPVTSNDLDFLVGPPGHGPCLRHPEFYFEGLTVTFLVRAFFFPSSS